MQIRHLPLEERPRERLENHGELALSIIELIAVIIGNGTKGKSVLALSQELLGTFGSLVGLAEAGINDLCAIKGLGKAKAIQLKAALGLGQRLARQGRSPRYSISTPEQAYFWVRDRIALQKREIFGAILQDTRGNAMRWEEISVGTLTQTLVHPREVFSPAIHYRAASLILAHNHPSGDPTPSPQDIILTRNLIQASRVIGIPIHDHIIVSSSSFFSLKQEGFIKL
ncbi:MAG: DNA repair protein RadC [Chlamydiales bacterium]